MEQARVPTNFFNIRNWLLDLEADYEAQSLECKTRPATPDDITRITPKQTITLDICAEMGLTRNAEKKPEYPYELGLNRTERSQHSAYRSNPC